MKCAKCERLVWKDNKHPGLSSLCLQKIDANSLLHAYSVLKTPIIFFSFLYRALKTIVHAHLWKICSKDTREAMTRLQAQKKASNKLQIHLESHFLFPLKKNTAQIARHRAFKHAKKLVLSRTSLHVSCCLAIFVGNTKGEQYNHRKATGETFTSGICSHLQSLVFQPSSALGVDFCI